MKKEEDNELGKNRTRIGLHGIPEQSVGGVVGQLGCPLGVKGATWPRDLLHERREMT
jgi:hypothetical protein